MPSQVRILKGEFGRKPTSAGYLVSIIKNENLK